MKLLQVFWMLYSDTKGCQEKSCNSLVIIYIHTTVLPVRVDMLVAALLLCCINVWFSSVVTVHSNDLLQVYVYCINVNTVEH